MCVCVCVGVCLSVCLIFCRSVVSSQSRSMNGMCAGVFACASRSRTSHYFLICVFSPDVILCGWRAQSTNQLTNSSVCKGGSDDAVIQTSGLILDIRQLSTVIMILYLFSCFFLLFFICGWPAISRKGMNTVFCILYCSFALYISR